MIVSQLSRERLDAALAYAARGWHVFPVEPQGKRPMQGIRWREASTTDPETIRAWWKRWPKANIGLDCGKSGLVVLDFDAGKPEFAGDDLLEAVFRIPTAHAATGGGGYHFFFRQPEGEPLGNRRGDLPAGVDVRGVGGYVVLPPSVHPSGGRYTWLDDGEPAPLPYFILELLRSDKWPVERRIVADSNGKHPRANGSAYARRAFEDEVAAVRAAPVGARNETLNRAAFNLGQLVAGGELEQAEVEAALLDAALAAGLPEREARATIASGMNAGAREPRTAPVRWAGVDTTARAAVGMSTSDTMPTTWQPLPEYAHLPEELGLDASPWLDAYIAHSRQVSPRSWDDWHEAAGLFVLSTVAARRVYLSLGRGVYPNIFIALIARTSLFSKTGVASFAESLIREAGLGHLLAPDISTPQKFLSSLTPRLPDNWASLPPEEQERIRRRLAFAAQKGWVFDEFGNQLKAMRNPNSVMADFARLLKVLDDNKSAYTVATISRGEETAQAPYLAFMGMGTPANIRELASKGGEWWNDGLFARFALLSPPPDAKGSRARWELDTPETPPELVRRLREWDSRLGQPQLEVIYQEPENKKRAGTYRLEASPPPLTPCTLGDGVFEAFYRYDDAMRDLLEAMPTEDLDGSYARMAEKALRVAILLASLENGGRIEIRHWARAQAIAERWRKGLHNLLDTLEAAKHNEREALEERIIATVRKLSGRGKPPTPREVAQQIWGMSTQEAAIILDALARAGALEVAETTRKGTKRYKLPEP